MSIPPGWYDDGSGRRRHWDGAGWADFADRGAASDPHQTPAGWYRDPTAPGVERWWNGSTWGEHVRPASAIGAASEKPVRVPTLVAAVLLLAAVLPLDYGYYTFLRTAITVVAIWVAVAASRASQTGWVVLGIVMAVLFNPIFPVWLSKEMWIPLDIVGAVVMIAAGGRVRGAVRP